VGYENVVTWYETPCAGYEMLNDGCENEISMKFAVHRQRYEKLRTVRKQIQRYTNKFKGVKQFVQGMNFLI
jgi:hypothetical protein